MLFLVSGASGMGKSSVRERLALRLGPTFEAVELRDLGRLERMTIEERQELAEVAVARAAALSQGGRHLLLAGEAVAAPSAILTGGIAACILDADAETQAARLRRRGDPEDLLPLHLGFAQWMRDHAIDPLPRLAVLTAGGWKGMLWERFDALEPCDPRWRVPVIDTSALSPEAVADRVASWIGGALADESLVMRPQSWSD